MFGLLSRVCQPVVHTSKRNVASIGKHFANKRREAAAAAAAAKGPEEKKTRMPKVVPPEVQAAMTRTRLITAVDSKYSDKRVKALEKAVNSDVEFLNRELTQLIHLSAAEPALCWKYACQIFQKILDSDNVPERGAFRGLLRTLELAQQWKAANQLFEFLADVYPVQQYDEVGMLMPKTVLTKDIPSIVAYTNIDASENTYEEMVKFIEKRTSHGRPPRYETLHEYMRQLIARNQYDEAVKIAFSNFHRADVSESPEVPAPFSPIYLHHVYRGTNIEFKLDYPLYYKIADYLERTHNYSAAMQIYIYMRSLNRSLDITPIREVLSSERVRDYADLHTYKPKQVGYLLKHWLKELRLRRGYSEAVKAKVSGVEGAKTYLRTNPHEAALVDTSPLVNTKVEPLVLLCDRSYKNQDVRTEKPANEILANYVVEELSKTYGIKANICKASLYSSNYELVQYLEQSPKEIDDIHRELCVLIPPEELEAYAVRANEQLRK